MPTHQLAADRRKFMQRTSQQLHQVALLHRRAAERQGQRRQRGSGLSATGVKIRQGVIGGDASHQPRVRHQAAQNIQALQLNASGRRCHHGRVLGTVRRGAMLRIALAQLGECRRQRVATHLRAATTARCLRGGGECFGQGIRSRVGHVFGQGGELRHETTINTVFPAPGPGAAGDKRAPLSDRTTLPQRQQGEKTLLRPVRAQWAL